MRGPGNIWGDSGTKSSEIEITHTKAKPTRRNLQRKRDGNECFLQATERWEKREMIKNTNRNCLDINWTLQRRIANTKQAKGKNHWHLATVSNKAWETF